MTKQTTTPSVQVSSSSKPKLPPHSIEAEQAVLGALMLDHRAWDRIADRLVEIDFYRQDHRLIFNILQYLSERGQPFDVLTVSEALKQQQKIEAAGGETYLFELAKNTPTAANIVAYADIVRERAMLRQLVHTGTDIVDSVFNAEGRDVKELVDAAESLVFRISEQRARGSGPLPISDLLARTTDQIDTLYHSNESITGLATGFKDLDEMTSGLQKGDLIIVAGRPSMGKTCLIMNMVEEAAMKSDKPALVFSLEMPAEALTMRMMSSLGRIDQNKVRTGKLAEGDWPRLTSAVSMLSEAKLYIDDASALTPGEIRARARRLAREHGGLSMIGIDYLQLMTTHANKENRATEISEISRSLKALAKELGVPVVVGSQLNRSLEQRTDKRPIMSDLRESGAIEQDADLILFIYRDEVYHEDSPYKGMAEIIVGKQRNGPIGKVRLTFLGQYTRFENHVPTDSVMLPDEVFS